MLPRQTLSLALLMAGCAVYHPKPLSSLTTAGVLESRSLNDSGLKSFVEDNLRRRKSWPPKSWDLATLTLVSFYYHPDLQVARAKMETANAAVVTAGARPNPTLGWSPTFAADSAPGISPWTLGFTLDVPIETAGKRGHRIAQAQALANAARLNVASSAWRIRAAVRKALVDVYAATLSRDILTAQQAAQTQNVELLEQRLQAGDISVPQVSLARVTAAQAALLLRDAEKLGAEARARLSVLMRKVFS